MTRNNYSLEALEQIAPPSNAIPQFESPSSHQGGLAIVTGGAQGIGLALAERAARCGMIPVVLDLKPFSEEKALRDAGAPDVFSLQCDCSSRDAIFEAAKKIFEKFPNKHIALLCANAGIAGPGLMDVSQEEWELQIRLCMGGTLWLFRAFIDKIMQQAPRPCAFVATASLAAMMTYADVYSVSKKGTLAIVEGLSLELQTRKVSHISLQVLCPEIVKTPMGDPSTPFGRLLLSRGMPPGLVAQKAFEGIASGVFYNVVIHPDPEMRVAGPEAMKVTFNEKSENLFETRKLRGSRLVTQPWKVDISQLVFGKGSSAEKSVMKLFVGELALMKQ